MLLLVDMLASAQCSAVTSPLKFNILGLTSSKDVEITQTSEQEPQQNCGSCKIKFDSGARLLWQSVGPMCFYAECVLTGVFKNVFCQLRLV